MAGCIKMPLGMEVGLGPGDFVRWGPPPQEGAEPPIFGPCLLWPNGSMDQDAIWYGATPPPRGHCIVLNGDAAPPPLKGHSPQFSSLVRCGQTAEWTKIPLGMKVGLGAGDFVLDGDPAPPLTEKGYSSPPLFDPCLFWPWLPILATAELLIFTFYCVLRGTGIRADIVS